MTIFSLNRRPVVTNCASLLNLQMSNSEEQPGLGINPLDNCFYATLHPTGMMLSVAFARLLLFLGIFYVCS
jgi:hypothetical protein